MNKWLTLKKAAILNHGLGEKNKKIMTINAFQETKTKLADP
jgi:hypothetical protein